MTHDDDEPLPTEEELRAAEALARALEEKDAPAGSDAAFARAIGATNKPAPIEASARGAIVDRAIARGRRRSRSRFVVIGLAAAAVLLLAISIPLGAGWLAITRLRPGEVPAAAPLSYGGPTDVIFGAPFPDEQHASARMDRIASSRAHDYFAALRASGGAR